MRLIELCSPFISYVASLKRAARRGAELTCDAVRTEAKKILKKTRSDAASDPDLEDQYDKVELPLVFFLDFVILESIRQLSREWEPLAYERNELAGDQKFFEMLEATLADESDKATERLVVYHMCLGLGFTRPEGEPSAGGRAYMSFVGANVDALAKINRRVYNRVRKALEIKPAETMCPEAYEHVDRANYVENTGRKLIAMAIALAGLVCVLVIANFFLFRWTSTAIITVLDEIQGRAGTPVAHAPAEQGIPKSSP